MPARSHGGSRRPRRALLLALLLGLLLAGLQAPAAHASPKICVYVEDRVVLFGSTTGHAFVQLLPDSGIDKGRRDLVWGFHPKTEWRFLDGPGKVQNEADHGWTWKICFDVSASQYESANRQIAADIARPPDYVFFKFNCTSWAYRIANAATLKLPSAKVFFGKTDDPAELASNLKALHNKGGTFAGGRIYPNSRKVRPRNSIESKHGTAAARAREELEGTESPFEIADLAFGDPRAAARGLDMSAHRATLPEARVGAAGSLRLFVDGPVDPETSLTEVRFGDGTRSFQSTRTTHSYRNPGRYRVRGVVIANAAVYRFRFIVEVDGGRGDAIARTTAPRGTPRPDRLPVLEPAITPCSLGPPPRRRPFDNTIRGTPGPDTLRGTPQDDLIIAGGGDDRVMALGGEDVVIAGRGADEVWVGEGDDRAYGGAGGDQLTGGFGEDAVNGGNGRDLMNGGPGCDRGSGGEGADKVIGNGARDLLLGGSHADRLSGGADDDRLHGGGGRDRLHGGRGRNRLRGGRGRDRVLDR